MKKIIINKFGGTIMAEGVYRVQARERIAAQRAAGAHPVAVVSAASGITDLIERALRREEKGMSARECSRLVAERYEGMAEGGLGAEEREIVLLEIREERKRLEADLQAVGNGDIVRADAARARGEKLASTLFAAYLRESGIPARAWYADRAGLLTTDTPGDADIIARAARKSMERLRAESELYVPVVTGFIGVDEEGRTTTLGRGGSDTTACFIGSALRAARIVLWKELGCVLSADPRVVKDAVPVAELSYEEAERAGKVICRKAVAHLKDRKAGAEVVCIADEGLRTALVPGAPDAATPKIIAKEWRPANDTDATVRISVVGGSSGAVLASVSRLVNEKRAPAEILSFSRTPIGSDICMRVAEEEIGNEIVRALHDEHIGGKNAGRNTLLI